MFSQKLSTLVQHFVPILHSDRKHILLEFPLVFFPVKFFGPLGPILDRVGPRHAKNFRFCNLSFYVQKIGDSHLKTEGPSWTEQDPLNKKKKESIFMKFEKIVSFSQHPLFWVRKNKTFFEDIGKKQRNIYRRLNFILFFCHFL